MYKISIVPVFIYCLMHLEGHSQNLVMNGSFEDYSTCPENYNTVFQNEILPYWKSPSAGTPDYFNVCSNGNSGIPDNWTGISNAPTGNGYVGAYLYKEGSSFREHFQGEFLTPLIKGEKYKVGFKLNQAFYAQLISKRIEVSFSSQPVKSSIIDFDIPVDSEAVLIFELDTSEESGWGLYQMEYIATGNEKYITIGNFSFLKNSDYIKKKYWKLKEPMLKSSSYIHLDDVFVNQIRVSKGKLKDSGSAKSEFSHYD